VYCSKAVTALEQELIGWKVGDVSRSVGNLGEDSHSCGMWQAGGFERSGHEGGMLRYIFRRDCVSRGRSGCISASDDGVPTVRRKADPLPHEVSSGSLQKRRSCIFIQAFFVASSRRGGNLKGYKAAADARAS
jgi:hypothetical protein